ncbi:MAG TPA: RluA family pseudouridine synthase [Sedimentisphaerales bacterium]|nr:RluA family pseudouridine synthase [Sedimentisphaerales bacterium]
MPVDIINPPGDEPLEKDVEETVTPPDDEDAGERLVIRVSGAIKERRLDKYLQGRFSQFSRTTIQRLIKEQGVKVNGQDGKPSRKLSRGDVLELILPALPSREIEPQNIPLNIVYEDEHMIVLNKQADLIVHPARGYKNNTLVNGLVYYAANIAGVGEVFRPGIVHRLDKNTTGVLVVAKTDTAHWRISKQFELRTTQKTYLAICHGIPELDADRINQPLGIHPSRREKYAVRPSGKEAVTFYEVLEKFRGYSLVQVSPKTGRTHQIRVHLSHIRHPIVADDMYGGAVVYPWQIEDRPAAVEEPLLARCALHAWKLELNHPETGRRMTFEAPLPSDMQQFLGNLRTFRRL